MLDNYTLSDQYANEMSQKVTVYSENISGQNKRP